MIPTAESVLEFKLSNFRQKAQWAIDRANQTNSQIGDEYTFDDVDWGKVKGWKVFVKNAGRLPSKSIHYLLKMPGGASIVDVECKNLEFNEKSLEDSFLNLTVQSNPPMPED